MPSFDFSSEADMEALSGKAIDWALLFLRHHRLVDAVGDGSRNIRYLRYRVKVEGKHGQ